MEQPTPGTRLNKYLASCGLCSRREADRMVEEGRVTINGRPCQSGMKVFPGDLVEVDGRPVEPTGRARIIALHKPRGYVTTTDRRWGDPLVEDLLNEEERLFPVGRLDRESEGLLLMTNQGDLAQQIMRGRNGHEKEYIVTVDKPVTETFLKQMRAGVYLKELERTTRKCRVWKQDKNTFRIVLTEGMNRQIRRMCEACGCSVVRLVRVRVMNVLLGSLQPGCSRDLSEQEKEELYRMLASGDNRGSEETHG